jgi:type VI protein secretion system component Hcp
MKRILSAFTGLSLALSFAAANAAEELYLDFQTTATGAVEKIGSSHTPGLEGWVRLLTMSAPSGGSQTANKEGSGGANAWGGGSVNRPAPRPLEVTVGAAESQFVTFCQKELTSHGTMNRVEIRVLKTGSGGTPSATITYQLKNVLVTSVSGAGSGQRPSWGRSSNAWGEAAPVAKVPAGDTGTKITFTCQQIQVQNGGSNSSSPTSTGGWDIKTDQGV